MVKSFAYWTYVISSFILICLIGTSTININFGSIIDIWLKIFVCLHILLSLGWAYEILFKQKIKKNKVVQIIFLSIYVIVSFVFEILIFTMYDIILALVCASFFILISIFTSIKLYDEIKTLE